MRALREGVDGMMHALGVGWCQADPAYKKQKPVVDDEECRLLLPPSQFHSRESRERA